ncbi:MAG: DUF192 domain-containing protein [Flavobacteriaceae bacterium]
MIKVLKRIVFILIPLSVILSCKENSKQAIKTEAIVFQKEGELSIYRQKTDTLIATLDIEIADSDYETQTGLMYRSSMADKQGMLFIFPNEAMHAFYMKNTEFPLDLIFIKADLGIASFQENTQPFSEDGLSSKVPVQYVLEVNAGLVQQWGLEIGDKINFTKD